MTHPQRDITRDLFDSIQARRRPEDVAALVVQLFDARPGEPLGLRERGILKSAAKHAKRGLGGSSMPDDFSRPAGMQHLAHAAAREYLFPQVPTPSAWGCDSIEVMQHFARDCGNEIGKEPGLHDFASHRLAAAQRRERGLKLSRRKYNRLFRFAARLDEKIETLSRDWARYECLRVGKTRLATRLSWEEFNSDSTGQTQGVFGLLRRALQPALALHHRRADQALRRSLARSCWRAARRSRSTNWFAIAHLFPDAQVLARLTDEHKGALLAAYFDQLCEIASLLQETWQKSDINRATMIVQRGNDSSTWNAAATGWNAAREGWIALLHAMGADSILDAMCPGKVLVLVAGDLAWMHMAAGHGLDRDTPIWAELPLPWQVLLHGAPCPRAHVEEVCKRHDVDPQKSGWSAPHARGQAVKFSATPELVHGVEVKSPQLAKVLREAGVFSGKKVQWEKLKG
jgi:hypothetical protein